MTSDTRRALGSRVILLERSWEVFVPRPRHPDKDLEPVLASAERQGWLVEKGRKYYKMKCPCREKHLKTVKLTPSGGNYKQNLLGQLNRATCWRDDE